MNPADLVAAAAASQEPLEADALAPQGWAVHSIADAEFAGECVGESQAEIAAVDAQLADLIARATKRAEEIKAKAQRRVAFFTATLVEFAEKNKDDLLIGKKKSRELVSVTFAWRKKGGRLVVTDKEALQAWLSGEDPGLFRVEIKPEMKAIQDLFRATGVIPPGMDLEPETEALTVTATPLPTLTGKVGP